MRAMPPMLPSTIPTMFENRQLLLHKRLGGRRTHTIRADSTRDTFDVLRCVHFHRQRLIAVVVDVTLADESHFRLWRRSGRRWMCPAHLVLLHAHRLLRVIEGLHIRLRHFPVTVHRQIATP